MREDYSLSPFMVSPGRPCDQVCRVEISRREEPWSGIASHEGQYKFRRSPITPSRDNDMNFDGCSESQSPTSSHTPVSHIMFSKSDYSYREKSIE